MTSKIILVVVAHPDDETIGMGATIKKHANNKDRVHVVSMTDGVSSREGVESKSIIERKKSANLASEYLGFKWEKNFDFDDNAMDKYPILEIIKSIEVVKKKVDPDIVYTHSGADLNIDHRVVANAVITVFRPQPNEKCNEIRLFEVASATDYGSESILDKFNPNLFINIKDTWDAKESALMAYKTEMREQPHTRSISGIKNLAELRGNQVGLYMSEAFQIVRKIEK